MIDEKTLGNPPLPLRWICMSTRTAARALDRKQHPVSHTKVAQILHALNYRLRGNYTTEEGKDPPDREGQFRPINAAAKRHLKQVLPVILVDAKKKELIRNYHHVGQPWRPARSPAKVQGHPFPRCCAPILRVSTVSGAIPAVSISAPITTPGPLRWRAAGACGNSSYERLADHRGRPVSVCHFPPGTSQWNTDRAPSVLFYLIERAW